MKIAISTLGCKVNQSESAFISGMLKERGHEIVSTLRDNPDVFIINTCSVTAKSDYQSRQMVRRAVNSGARVIVTGCYAQLRPEEFLRIKGTDLILGNSEKDRLCEYINRLSTNNERPQVIVNNPESPLSLKPYFLNRARAFLKIQDGCNFSCSYCIVPKARGKSRSLSTHEVYKAVRELKARGYKEIVLTGIHIGSYGFDLRPKSSLLEIVDKITSEHPDIRIRLTSIEPQEFKGEFLSLIKKGGVCPHLHIPLQSGSDRILRAMNRGYSTSFYKALINDIYSEYPDISIGTDIIAGFPGETEEDFEHTVEFIENLPLSYIHVFSYSPRPGTKASEMDAQIDSAEKKRRVRILMEISKNKKNNYISKFLGKKLDVIVEEKDVTSGFYRGTSDNYIKLLIRADRVKIGERIEVRACELTDKGLVGIPLNHI